ncbi:MAG TPA: NAD-dependent epimerase/dehydratase family protein [Daejeonella sp.]|uniref:NAD-dependent epimerase/dehydratase family protein n=1 Tax=Daejeonella sp. TaxID=2805397 RepID=UPI002EDB8561
MNNNIKVFVTGASGFIGRSLCYALAKRGYLVHALCRNVNHPFLLKHENISFYNGDILDESSLKHGMNGCQFVYHTAAMAKMWCRNNREFYDVNVLGTRNVLKTAMFLNVQKLVYTSTCGVWGPTIKHPMDEYSPRIAGFPIVYERTKFLAELEVNSFVDQGLNIVTVNPSRVFGEGPVTDSNTVSKMIKGYLNGTWRIIPGKGDSVANYAFLDDVVEGHIAAMEYGLKGNRYILGGEDISFNRFFETLFELTGKHLQMLRIPQKMIKMYSQVDWLKTQITGIPPVFLPEFADRLKYDQKYSSAKAIEHLNYKITPFALGMGKTVHYLQNQRICRN